MADWIDELDHEEDDKTKYQELMSALYKSRTFQLKDWGAAWDRLIWFVEDDEMTDERGLLGPKEIKAIVNRKRKTDLDEGEKLKDGEVWIKEVEFLAMVREKNNKIEKLEKKIKELKVKQDK